MGELTRKIIHGVIWNLSGSLGNQAAQFIITLFLARLISPEEFGMVAMLTVFTAVANTLVEGGYGPALIQKQQATPADESSAFYVNLLVSLALYIVLWFAATPIAHFYQEPRLVPLTRWLALLLILNAAGVVQSSLMTKRMDFKTLNRVSVLATCLSGCAGIVLALRGYGVWSLVAQSLMSALVRSSLLWCFSPWRPQRVFCLDSVRSLFSYGSKLLVSGLLNTIFDNLFALVIGKNYTKADLGYYSRAQLTQRFITATFTSTTGNVVFPAYAAIQDDRALLREGYRKTIIFSSLIAFPVMLGLAVMAKPLFQVIYSATWLPSAPYFALLCISGSIFHLHAYNLNVLKATGRTDYFLRLEVVKKLLILVGFLLTYRYGILAMVYGQVVVSFIGLFINTYYTGILIDYTMKHQCLDVWPFAGLSMVMAAAMACAGAYLAPPNPYVQLAVMSAVGIAVYGGVAYYSNLRGTTAMARRVFAQLAPRPAEIPSTLHD